jgi:putative transposase
MPTTARPQQRYDHRLRHLVERTGDMTVATNLGVPRSTARGWLGVAPTVVVCLDVADLTEPEMRQEVLKLRRRVQKLTALLRLALALLRTSGVRLTGARLPDGRAKMRILRAVDRAGEYLPLRAVLRFLRVSPRRFHAWCRRQSACALDDQSSDPRTSPSPLTLTEVRAIEDMVTSPDYRHVPTGTLGVLAQRLATVWASPSTWYHLVHRHGWRRPRLRVHPVKPKIGLRTTRANEMWHIDTTVIRILDGTRAYLHAVIDNFSRRILAWQVADTFAPVNSVTVLLDALRHHPGRAGGCGRGERERPGRRLDPDGRAAPAAGLHGAEVLEFHDRSVVALPQASMALPPLAGQHRHRPSTGGVLRRPTQPRAAAFGVSRTDA